MHPEAGEAVRRQGGGVGAAALGDFVFVVGEHQIGPAAVDVEAFA